MDLIAQGIAAALAFFAGIAGNIFAHDICASANTVCTKIIKAASRRLHWFAQSETEQQWLADLHEFETVFEKYRHAIGCFLAAPEMKRAALAPPIVDAGPSLVWKKRRNEVWEARWTASRKALKNGYRVKSVKLAAFTGNVLTPEDKASIVEIVRELEGEQNHWLNDFVRGSSTPSHQLRE